MESVLLAVILVILWGISLVLAFDAGSRAIRPKKQPRPTEKPLSDEAVRAQRELENFLTYNGRAQD